MLSEEIAKMEQENITLKAQLKTLQDICGNRVELPKNCEYCSHFVQHYIKSGSGYYPTCDGHCVAGNRVKDRKTKETCKAFAERQYGKNFI